MAIKKQIECKHQNQGVTPSGKLLCFDCKKVIYPKSPKPQERIRDITKLSHNIPEPWSKEFDEEFPVSSRYKLGFWNNKTQKIRVKRFISQKLAQQRLSYIEKMTPVFEDFLGAANILEKKLGFKDSPREIRENIDYLKKLLEGEE